MEHNTDRILWTVLVLAIGVALYITFRPTANGLLSQGIEKIQDVATNIHDHTSDSSNNKSGSSSSSDNSNNNTTVGTNLLTGTDDHTVTATNNNYGYLSNENTNDLLTLFKRLEGQTITVSVDYKYSGFTAGNGWGNRLGWETAITTTDGTSWLGPWYYPKNSSGSGRISKTFVVPKNITSVGESMGYIQFPGSGTGTLSHLKIEKGSKATPYTS